MVGRLFSVMSGKKMKGSIRQHWLDTSLRKKGLAVVALPTIALLVSFFGLVSVVFASRSASNGVRSSLETRSSLESVLTLTISAETGVRGYLLTSDPNYLSPYRTAAKELPRAFEQLNGELIDDKQSLNNFAQLKAADSADLSILTQLLNNAGSVAGSPSRATLIREEKKQTDTVRALVSKLETHVTSLVTNKEAAANDVANAGLWIAVLALLIGLVGGAVATQLFTTGIASRILKLQERAERLARGEPLNEVRDAADEVGKLAGALAQASGLLMNRESALLEESAFLEHLVTASPVVKFQSTTGLPGNGFVSANLDRVFAMSSSLVNLDPEIWLHSIDSEDRDRVVKEAQNAIASRKSELTSTYRVRGNDGIQRWVFSITRLTHNDDNGETSALGVLLDITEQREAVQALREREEMLGALFHASPDAIVVLDNEGRPLLESRAFSELTMFDTSSQGSSQQTIFDYLDPNERALTSQKFASLLSGDAPYFTERMRFLGSENEWCIMEGHGVTLQNGVNKNNVLLILRDVTQQVDLENRLTRATNTAEMANRAKSDFLSRMSHELRTPLNAVLGFAQLLELDELSEEQSEAVGQIRRGGQHLLQLINEVLDIARIEAGRLALSREKVGIVEVAEEVCALLKPLAEARRIEVVLISADDDEDMVLADRQRLRQILLNLVSNAIKYNHLGGSVNVTYSHDAEVATISVIDTGPGISPEQVELAFAPFERLGAETGEIEGTGIGLTLSRHLAEAMGGSLRLESSGAGSTFMLDLPFGGTRDTNEGKYISLNSGWRDSRSSAPLQILYVEDNISNILLVERACQRIDNVKLVVANHGQQALTTMRQEAPDLVLLDLHLPDIGGDQVLAEIRSEASTANTPVVILSADATESQIRKLLAAGATDYLTKPIDIERLFEIIEGIRLSGQDANSKGLGK